MDFGETIRDVILRITGDGDDARRELERLALDLTKFGRKEAEADAKINTAKAKADLKALERQFERIDGRDLSATAKVRLGKAMAELQALQARLDAIDDRDVDIDVNLRRDLEDRLQGLGVKAAQFADILGDVDRRSRSAGESIADTNVNVFNMNTRLGRLVKMLPALIPMLVGFVAQIVALGASAIQAVGGLGALAVALGGALVSAVAIGGAAFFRFKETMETAGTPAYRIVQIVGQIGEAMAQLSRAADPILHAIANNLGGVFDVLQRITPAFFKLGQAAGKAVGWLMQALTSPSMANAIATLLELSGPVMKPLVQIIARFAKILLGIANATMPFLVAALQGLANWLGKVARSVDHLGKTREVVGGMIDHLRSWWNLLVQVVGVFGELVRIAAPFGKAMVDSLAKGAEHLREWLDSKEGTERVQQFFEDTLPLASEMIELIAKLALAFIQFAQFMAPVWRPIVAGITDLLDAVNMILNLLNKIPAPIREVVGTVLMLVVGFGKLKVAGWGISVAFRLILGALGVLGGAFSKALSFVKDFAVESYRWVRDKLADAKEAVVRISGEIRDWIATAWGDVKETTARLWDDAREKIVNTVQDIRERAGAIADKVREKIANAWDAVRTKTANAWDSVREAIRNKLDAARTALGNLVDAMREKAGNVWDAIRTKAANIFDSIREAIRDKLEAAKTALGNLVDAMLEKAGNVWDAIRTKAANIFDSIREAIKEKIDAAKTAVGNAVDGMAEKIGNAATAFYNGGKALIENLIKGFMSKVQELYDKVKGAVDKVTGLLPGSEPRDPNSPLRGLPRRGRAIIGNLVKGITEAGPDLVNAVSRELAGVASAGPPGLAGGTGTVGLSPAVQRAVASQPAHSGLNLSRAASMIIENLNITPIADGGSPDPEVLAAQLSMALRTRVGGSSG